MSFSDTKQKWVEARAQPPTPEKRTNRMEMETVPLDSTGMAAAKRILDVVFSLIMILGVMSWLLPLLALLIKLDSPGPVFYVQKRTGLNGQSFNCFKLRSMFAGNIHEEKQVTKNDKRVTRVGHWLRISNFDEYPQFFNVLLGQMSIVGPRPHMVEHTAKYSQLIPNYMQRHRVKPGITGLSQIKGFRGETINPILMQSRINEDIYYIQNWSFLLDLKIILLTMLHMLKTGQSGY
ncbi:MAG: sugar transferase [Bacteroidia bacterium]